MTRRKRNPRFTADELQTASLLVAEGSITCIPSRKDRVYKYPRVRISMCDKEALEPAQRVFGTTIAPHTRKVRACPPHLFPPEGKGIWEITRTGKTAKQIIEHLKPLLTREFLRKWEKVLEECR